MRLRFARVLTSFLRVASWLLEDTPLTLLCHPTHIRSWCLFRESHYYGTHMEDPPLTSFVVLINKTYRCSHTGEPRCGKRMPIGRELIGRQLMPNYGNHRLYDSTSTGLYGASRETLIRSDRHVERVCRASEPPEGGGVVAGRHKDTGR